MTLFRRLTPARLAVLSVLAVTVGVLFAMNASAFTAADPVPTCAKPSSDPSHQDQVDYAACLQSRTESLLATLQQAPTVTETVTVTTTPSPTGTPTSTPTETPTETPTSTITVSPSPTPTQTPTSTPTTPTGVPKPADFPTATSVGPATQPTAIYAGSCRVTTDDLVIDSQIVNCQDGGLVVTRDTTGVVIRNSIVRGGVFTEFTPGDPELEDNSWPTIFTVDSSRVVAATTTSTDRAIGFGHFVVRDSFIQGSHSGMWAFNKAVVEDSYITTDGTSTHQSGLRMMKNSTLRGNTILCAPAGTAQDGGCSADGVFYREFGVPSGLTIERNYFRRLPGIGQWYATRFIDCAAHDDCVDITFTGNLFDLGQGTDGGEFPNDRGDVWSDNYWTDGTPALSGQSR